MSDASEAFTELFFGEGALFGLVLYIVIIALSSLRVRYLGVLFMPVSFLFALEYIERATNDNYLIWCAVITFIEIPFLVYTCIRKGDGL